MNRWIVKVGILCTVLISMSFVTVPSKYVSRTGHIHVETNSRYLDVIADNYQVYCEINPTSGAVKLRGLVKSFEFELGALDRAFNSGRVNLQQFSKFEYKGKVVNLGSIDFSKPGVYPIRVEGTLYMGEYKRVTKASGNLVVNKDGTIRSEASFGIKIEEQSVQTINRMMKEKLPSVMAIDADKLGISRDIQLRLKANFRPR